MVQIKLYLNDLSENNFICAVNKGVAMGHLVAVRKQLLKIGETRGPKRVVLMGAGAVLDDLRYIVYRVGQERKNFNLSLEDLPLPDIIGLNRAIEVLNVQPSQDHVEPHIMDYLRRGQITPADLKAIEQAYHNCDHRVYLEVMQTLAYLFEVGAFTLDEADAMIEESEKHPDLNLGILHRMEKIRDAREREAEKDAKQEAKEKREEEEEERRQEEKDRRRQAGAANINSHRSNPRKQVKNPRGGDKMRGFGAHEVYYETEHKSERMWRGTTVQNRNERPMGDEFRLKPQKQRRRRS